MHPGQTALIYLPDSSRTDRIHWPTIHPSIAREFDTSF